MEDLNLSPTGTLRQFQVRAPAPHGSALTVPKPIRTWINRIHPDTKAKTQLLHKAWDAAPANRIFESFESRVFDNTLVLAKTRSSLTSDDTKSAPVLFRLGPCGKFAHRGMELRALRLANTGDRDHNTEGPSARQLAKITTWVDAADDLTSAADKPVLEFHCALFPQDATSCAELVRVYDSSLCHFTHDAAVPEMGRLLNSARLRALNAATPTPFGCLKHKKMLLDQFVDTADADDLFTFFITPREEGLSLQLWIAERRASRALVEKDNGKMPELHWLACTTNFLTSDERALLKMPADRDMAAYDTGYGCTMTILEEACDSIDPLALKRFRQSPIKSSLGKRVLAIDKAMKAADSAKSSSSSSKKQKEDFSADQTAAEKKKASGSSSKKIVSTNGKAPSTVGQKVPNTNGPNFDPDSPSVLPHKNGALDTSRHENWEASSLRRRCWDRTTASPPQCVRCGDPAHSRKSCKQPALPWALGGGP
jgi:hypothetical protein